jgi:hypothetical protein
MTRIAGPAKINEGEAYAAVPAEMAVLDRLVGDWQNDSVMKTPDKPAGVKVSMQLKSRKIFGGLMIESQETRPPGQNEAYWLATYDPEKKVYRHWFCDAHGAVIEMIGAWDRAAERFQWSGAWPGGIRFQASWQWKGPDRREWDFVMRDADGKLLSELQGTCKRVPVPADPNAPENVLSRYIGTWNMVTETRFPPPKKSEDARVNGVIVSEAVGGGKFLRNYSDLRQRPHRGHERADV